MSITGSTPTFRPDWNPLPPGDTKQGAIEPGEPRSSVLGSKRKAQDMLGGPASAGQPPLPRVSETSDTKHNPGTGTAADNLPDVIKLRALVSELPQLSAPGIQEIVTAGDWPAGTRLIKNVRNATGKVSAYKVNEGEAAGLFTTGTATCLTVCARGNDGKGATVLAMGHYEDGGKDIFRDFEKCMSKQGVTDYQMYIVGGQIETETVAPDDDDDDDDQGDQADTSLAIGEALIRTGGARVVAARIGLSESERDPPAEGSGQPWEPGLTTGRPASVSVAITTQGVFYARERSDGGSLISDQFVESRDDEPEDVLDRKQGPYGFAPTSGDLPELARLRELFLKLPVLRAAGIDEIQAGGLPEGIVLLENVDMEDTEPRFVTVGEAGMDALFSSGVATCHAVCARGVDSKGATVLAMQHCPDGGEDVITKFDKGMAARGVARYDMYILGGQMSTELPDEGSSLPRVGGTLHLGEALIGAGGKRVVAARLGLSETERARPGGQHSQVGALTTGRPESVSVAITAQGVYYTPEYDGTSFMTELFNGSGGQMPEGS